jgi:hypothetical protein
MMVFGYRARPNEIILFKQSIGIYLIGVGTGGQ